MLHFSPLFDIELEQPLTKDFVWKWGKPCYSSVFYKNILIRETSLASDSVVEEQDEKANIIQKR